MSNPNRAITIEPVVFLYASAVLLQLTVYQHYVYHRAQMELLDNDTRNIQDANHCNANLTSVDNEIQHRASKNILGIGLATTFPAIFTSLLYGPLSDRKGRRPIMSLPPLGGVIDACLALAVIYYELPVYVLVVGGIITGLSGNFTTLVFTVIAYVVDTTSDPSKLPLRMSILQAFSFLGGTMVQATSGLWIEHLGYAAPYWFLLSLYLTSLLYIIFSLPESSRNQDANYTNSCYSLKDLKALTGVITRRRQDNGHLKLWLLFISSTLVVLPVSVLTQLIILYSKDIPLCWQENLIGYFLASLIFARGVGSALFMKVLKWCNWRDYSIVQLGIVFLIALLVMIGLSTDALEMFLANILSLFSGLPVPCMNAQMSHIVDDTEQGSLFAINGAIESLCNFLAIIIFNPLYQMSLDFAWPHGNGFIFFINSGVAMIPLLLISWLKTWADRRQTYEALYDSENKTSA